MTESAEPKQELSTVQPAYEGSLMNLIAKMAADPSYDVSRFERLIALRNEELARQRKNAYLADFVQMKPHLPLVIKLHDNAQTKSRFAKLEDVNQTIDPILAKFNIGTSSKVIVQTDTTVTMILELNHKDGHIETMELTMPIDDKGMQGNANKTKIQGISSTITQIKKVGFCAMLNISTGDDKDGNQVSGFVTTEQAADIDLKLREAAKTYTNPEQYMSNFYKLMNAANALEISAKDYKKALNTIKPKAAP